MYFPERIPQASGDHVIAPIPRNSPRVHTNTHTVVKVHTAVGICVACDQGGTYSYISTGCWPESCRHR